MYEIYDLLMMGGSAVHDRRKGEQLMISPCRHWQLIDTCQGVDKPITNQFKSICRCPSGLVVMAGDCSESPNPGFRYDLKVSGSNPDSD